MKKYIALGLALALTLFGWFVHEGAKAGVTCTLPFNLQNNTTADATQVMANYNALVTCLTNAAAAGSNSDITALLGLTTPITPAGGGSTRYIGGTSGGTALVQTLTNPTPNGFSLAAGKEIIFTPGFTNTATNVEMTLNVNSLGAVNVHRLTPAGSKALAGGEFISGQVSCVTYDGTQFNITCPSAQVGGYGIAATLAAAATINIGSIPSHFIDLTGIASITSFGTQGTGAAEDIFPFYRIYVESTPTFVNSATLLLPSRANILAQAGDVLEVISTPTSGTWIVTNYVRKNGTAVSAQIPLPGFLGLSVKNNAGTPSTQIDWAYTYGTMLNIFAGNNVTSFAVSQSGTINLTNGTVTSTCNAMDGEARGTSAWIYLYAVSDGTTPCMIGSTSASLGGITLPSGYVYAAYAGAMRVDGSGNLLRSRQSGSDAQLVVAGSTTNVPFLTPIVSAVAANWASAAVSAFVPSTATKIKTIISVSGTSGRNIAVAPNASYPLAFTSTPTGFPCQLGSGLGSIAQSVTCDMVLESTNIFYMNTATDNGVFMYGWKDAVNAN